MGNSMVTNWVLIFIPDELHEDYTENTETYTRWIIGTTSAFVLLVTLLEGFKIKILSAPYFIKLQFLLIAVCNLAGILFSLSSLSDQGSIYDTWYGFAWEVTIILTYMGAGLLGQWLFAYQYLLTSRTLTEEVKSRNLVVEDEENIEASEHDQTEEQSNKQFCCSRKNLLWISRGWVTLLCLSMAVFIIGTAESWNCDGTCQVYEKWIGNTNDYIVLFMSALVLKIIVIVVFFVALLRIRNTAAQLIKHGYVASRTVLYLHIGFSVFDLVSCFVIAASALEHADAAQKTGTEGSGYKVLSALNFNQMYQVSKKV